VLNATWFHEKILGENNIRRVQGSEVHLNCSEHRRKCQPAVYVNKDRCWVCVNSLKKSVCARLSASSHPMTNTFFIHHTVFVTNSRADSPQINRQVTLVRAHRTHSLLQNHLPCLNKSICTQPKQVDATGEISGVKRPFVSPKILDSINKDGYFAAS
jgi:hypothetical protein